MRIREIGPSSCRVEVAPVEGGGAATAAGASACPPIHLLQCLPKGAKMDLIVRQAAEAGITGIVPVVSARSVVDASDPARRLARWRRIAREALQQSGNPRQPEIADPLPLRKAAALDRHCGIGLLFHQERISGGSLHAALAGAPAAGPGGIFMVIGPEGGLAEGEVDILRAAGFVPVHLGETVLRVETAALYAVAAVRTVIMERDAWKLSEQP